MKCIDCEFWYSEENKMGLCKLNPPEPFIINEMVHSCWPPTNEDDFCHRFVKRIAIEEERALFHMDKFIEWCDHAFSQHYRVDLEPNNMGIMGSIEAVDCPMGDEEYARFMTYFKQFFAEEDIDVSFR